MKYLWKMYELKRCSLCKNVKKIMYSLIVTTAKLYVQERAELGHETVCTPPSHYRRCEYEKQPTL
jgi:hypothetical protein